MNRPSHRAPRRRPVGARIRRAFTLLEVVLAAVLGAIVVLSSIAFFTAMDKAKTLQSRRLESNAELAAAHKIIQQALRTLLMDDSPDRREDETKSDIEKDIEDGLHNAQQPREDASLMRFALQPDPSKRDPYGNVLQTLDLTVTTPPVHYVTRSADAEAEIAAEQRQLAVLRQREIDIWDRRNAKASRASKSSGTASDTASASGSGSGKSGTSSGKSGSGSSRERDPDAAQSRAERLRAGQGELTGNAATRDPALALASQNDMEPARAPGVRGQFELRVDDDPGLKKRIDPADVASGEVAWSLWWRQIPPDDETLQPEGEQGQGVRDPRLLELARASRTDVPEVKLISGLKSAHWQVYRRRKMVSKMAAAHAKELPAYVEFKFETIDGRREDWMFEIAWSYGPEPGSVITAADPLASPNANLANINIKFDENGRPIPVDGNGNPIPNPNGSGPVAGGGDTKPSTNPSTNPHVTPGPGNLPNTGVSGGNGKPIVITLPGGGTITIPANAQPGGSR